MGGGWECFLVVMVCGRCEGWWFGIWGVCV